MPRKAVHGVLAGMGIPRALGSSSVAEQRVKSRAAAAEAKALASTPLRENTPSGPLVEVSVGMYNTWDERVDVLAKGIRYGLRRRDELGQLRTRYCTLRTTMHP